MKISRILTAVAALGAAAAGVVGLLGTAAIAGDETCDLVHGQIQACRDAHGHWSSACCCCKFR
jgi:hypothetical protein